MSQDNEKHNTNIWSWKSDAKGRIMSVSSSFAAMFGIQTSQTVVGNSFWKFITGLDKASLGWEEVEDAFLKHKNIKKFIFNHRIHGKDIKIALTGEPIFEKNNYIGHQGTGYLADSNEVSIPEIAKNMLSISLEGLDLGVAIFSKYSGLIEFNPQFLNHMSKLNITIKKNITYEKLVLSINNVLIYNEELSSIDQLTSHLCFEQKDKSIFSLTKSNIENNLIIFKTEINSKLLHILKAKDKNIDDLKRKNLILENRIIEYKERMTSIFNKKVSREDTNIDALKFLSFFENNLDIGVLVTNLDNTISKANYFSAQLFGYVTAEALINNSQDKLLNKFLSDRQETISYLKEASLNRYEHIIEFNDHTNPRKIKEVIVFFPNIYNPQKIVSFFYNEITDDYQVSKNIHAFLIDYLINSLKSSLNVIEGYNHLHTLEIDKALPLKYNNKIQDASCQILKKIKDIMNICKLSSDLKDIQREVFKISDVIDNIYEEIQLDIQEAQINFNIDIYNDNLFVISNQNIFYISLKYIIFCLVKSAKINSNIDIKIKGDLEEEKISLVIETNFKHNLQIIHETYAMHDYHAQYAKNLEYKIAQTSLEILGCEMFFENTSNNEYALNIEISGDMIIHKIERDIDNIAV